MRVAALVGEDSERLGFLERPEVLALNVLDERDLDDLRVVDLANDDRELPQPNLHRSLIPALARHDLESTAALPHDEGLDNPLLSDRGHQLRQVAHDLPGLVRV